VTAGGYSFLALVPQEGLGLFYWSADVQPMRGTPADKTPPDQFDIKWAMTRPLGFGEPLFDVPANAPAWRDSWSPYLGRYLSLYRGHFGLARLRSILHPQTMRVKRGERGLRIEGVDGFFRGAEGLVEVAPAVFSAPGMADSFVFAPDPATARMTISHAAGFVTYEKPAPLDDPHLLLPLLAALIALAASGFVLPFWRLPDALPSIAAIGLATIVTAGVGFLYGAHAFGDRYFRGIAWPIDTVRVCGFFIIPLAILLTVSLRRAWPRELRGRAALGRVHLFCLAMGAWVLVSVLIDVGLIGFSPPR
jgi:hypothetical protein